MKRKTKSLDLLNFNTKLNADNRLTRDGILLNHSLEHGISFHNRVIRLTGYINDEAFDIVDSGLTDMESISRSSVIIRINSEGGNVYDALAVVGRLKRSKCNIITEGYGQVMSSASLILACGHKRRMSHYSQFMWHEANYSLDEGTRHSSAKDYIEQAEKEEQLWAGWMAEFTNRDANFWKTTGVRRDAFFGAEELLELGVIDEII